MLIITFVIPIIACLVLLIVFRNYTVWWEYLVVLLPSILISLALYGMSVSSRTSDLEYLGYYVQEIEYYEDWNEYIHRTCTRTVKRGDNTYTETYDCSYVEYHPECWYMILNNDKSYAISKELYEKIKKKLGTRPVFVDLHRHYHTNDGDKYVCSYNKKRNCLYPITLKRKYRNKILGSRSLFNFSEVTEEEFKENNLKDYAEVIDYDQNPIMSDVYIPSNVVDSFKFVNALFGHKYQFRTYVIIFKNKERSITKLEQDFLVGGNNNELIVCIGTKDGKTIDWVESFSWEDEPIISVGVNHLYHSGDNLDLMKLNRYLINNIPKKWKRKEFDKDFNYLTTELSSGNWMFIYILTLIVNIVLSFYVITNEFR